MKLTTLMMFKSVICVIIGTIFVLAPGALLATYGVRIESGGVFMTRLYGAAFVLLGLLLWFARDLAESEARKAIVPAVFIGDAIAFVIALYGQLSGVANDLGWSVVLLYLLLTLGFGYFQISKPASA